MIGVNVTFGELVLRDNCRNKFVGSLIVTSIGILLWSKQYVLPKKLETVDPFVSKLNGTVVPFVGLETAPTLPLPDDTLIDRNIPVVALSVPLTKKDT